MVDILFKLIVAFAVFIGCLSVFVPNALQIGLLLLAGGPVRAGEIGAVTERDVAPTVLHLLGLPVSNELNGSVLLAAFDDAFRKAHPVRHVASYGRRPRARPLGSSFDRDVIEELRSLGYIR